ncbi:RNA polymerase-associated protein LEO1-like [Diorhabda carinulata]|uniref:RNA polymerase-associated protein LEO1-like n=1 Tax=Diorhabda carinulata TaxID=1163345 RepID=UPI0025A18AFF|nr:RNA polymerase-associated protein LEO1-like [Diorhabda carinulata]
MDEIITLASDEEETVSPPKKRINPYVLNNLPNVSITKVRKIKEKRQDIVVLSSDDDSDDEIKKKPDEKVECTNGKEAVDANINNDIIQIDDGDVVENNSVNDSIEIIDADNDLESTKNLDKSCQVISAESEDANTSKDNEIIDDIINDILDAKESDESVASPSVPDKPPNTILLDQLLKIIEEQTQDEKYTIIREKIPLLLSYYRKRNDNLKDCNDFKILLKSCSEKAEKSAALAVKAFHEVYQYLKEQVNVDSVEVEKRYIPHIQKLEKAIKQLVKVIKHLEEQEVDFDEEEDSAFIKLERYNNRLDKIYKKYCALLNKNPYSGRLTYAKLDFVDSDYNEINRAISKKFSNRKFPSYYEMEKFIGKVAKDNNLNLKEEKIKKESIHCFKRLGELLQNRRRKELYDSHVTLIKDTEDPAKENPELNTILKHNFIEGQKKIDKLVEGFVNRPEESSSSPNDSDDSDKSDDEDEEDQEEDNDDGEG